MPGGRYQPLSDSDIRKIHETILIVLENTGLSDAPAAVIDRVTRAGGRFTEEGRLLFPAKLVEAALDGFQRRFTLHGQVWWILCRMFTFSAVRWSQPICRT